MPALPWKPRSALIAPRDLQLFTRFVLHRAETPSSGAYRLSLVSPEADSGPPLWRTVYLRRCLCNHPLNQGDCIPC